MLPSYLHFLSPKGEFPKELEEAFGLSASLLPWVTNKIFLSLPEAVLFVTKCLQLYEANIIIITANQKKRGIITDSLNNYVIFLGQKLSLGFCQFHFSPAEHPHSK